MDGARLRNGRVFAELIDPTTDSRTSADGIRCDVDGNVWAGARPGVQVVAPDGDTIGVIRLPEVCANVCFGGAKRNRFVHDSKPIPIFSLRGCPRSRRSVTKICLRLWSLLKQLC